MSRCTEPSPRPQSLFPRPAVPSPGQEKSRQVEIVYVSFRGQFSDSPRALYEELVRRDVGATHTWLTDGDTQDGFPADAATVPFGTPESISALEAADVVIANDGISLDWRKAPGTIYLQTWHGTTLKRIHHDALGPTKGRGTRLDSDVARWDLLLSPNTVTTPRLRSGFGYRGPIHETGLPRNDLLSSPRSSEIRAAVRADLGIAEDQRVVLYTPTWRDDLVLDRTGPDFELPIDLDDFTDRLGDDHVLLLRRHHMVSDRSALPDGSPVRDVSAHPDLRELYLAADLMVTDYSSTMFDFAITGKPMLFLTYDLEHYRDEVRGFYFDLAGDAPGPLLSTSKELVDAIVDLDTVAEEHAGRYAAFRETFCHLEDGAATTRVLDLLFPSTPTPTS